MADSNIHAVDTDGNQIASSHRANDDRTDSLAFQKEQKHDLWTKANAIAFLYNLKSKLALGPC